MKAFHASSSTGRNVPQIRGPSGRSITAKPLNLRERDFIFGAFVARAVVGCLVAAVGALEQ